MEEHEEAATVAIWLIEALNLLSLVTLLAGWCMERLSRPLVLMATVLSLATFAAMARTGYLGGQIRHSEIRGGMSANGGAEANGAETGGEVEGEEQGDD